MKKIGLLWMSLLCVIGLSGCQVQENKGTVESIIENNQLKVEWDDIGLFWMCSFADMHMTVIFNDDEPQTYFAQHSLIAADIKTIQVYPDQTNNQQFFYLVYKNSEAQVNEQDLKDYQNEGRQEAYDLYQKKLTELDLTTKQIGEWILSYFNENVQQELVSQMKQNADELLKRIKKNGYGYQKDEKGRTIIHSSKGNYKIVIVNNNCMVVDNNMNLSEGQKTGYMYTPQQGTVGYMVNDKATVIYQYKDNQILEGTPSLAQYRIFKEIKTWYDNFLIDLDTDLATLSTLS